MKVKVITTINGEKITVIGKLNKEKTKVTDKKGMFLVISSKDIIEVIEPIKREKREKIYCPLDLHTWFRVNKKI